MFRWRWRFCWRFALISNRVSFFLLLVFVSAILSFLSVTYGTHPTKSSSISILLWYWPFGVPHSLKGDVCLEMYNITGCQLLDNPLNYSLADIVVFHHHELKSHIQKLHLPRPAYQKWLWLSLEAPENIGDLRPYSDIFNLTMTYRPDADVTMPYGKLVRRKKNGPFVLPMNKSHLVCWVVSNYRKSHKRTSVYLELKKTVPVQVYGRAFKKPLKQSDLLHTISNCYFYLAFENTISRYYITEKLWRNAFMAGTVPVVLGPPRSDYEAVAPPNSFIHVDDFSSVDALGRFLKELASDSNRYRSYLTWHMDYSVKLYNDWRERLCNICPIYDKLSKHNIHHQLGL